MTFLLSTGPPVYSKVNMSNLEHDATSEKEQRERASEERKRSADAMSFNNLPEDIQLRIFQFLDNEDLENTFATCRSIAQDYRHRSLCR